MAYDSLINYLLLFGSLNKQQIDLITSSLTVKYFEEGAYFLKAGQVSRDIGFVTRGIFRVCYYDNDGNEITRYFVEENHFIADINSYNTLLPTTEYVQAVVDCEVIILSRQVMENLSRTILVWDSLIAKIVAKSLAEKVSRISVMMPQDAAARYQYFLEAFPNVANRVPLQYIASYIGVTKSSLSRLRRHIGKRK
ncbi:MAG TPA: Crp/Fnr family transcriptional regulator [Chitinophagaceae bacterium]|nr:Crp/Fnr family transcriptional regulator [Chitinophagaceae bacterium]